MNKHEGLALLKETRELILQARATYEKALSEHMYQWLNSTDDQPPIQVMPRLYATIRDLDRLLDLNPPDPEPVPDRTIDQYREELGHVFTLAHRFAAVTSQVDTGKADEMYETLIKLQKELGLP